MKLLLSVLVLICASNIVLAQFQDDFSDGDITNNPTWFGEDSIFIVNGSNELQLDAYPITTDAFLATESEAIENAVWEFQVKLDFNPSGSNYSKVYLASNTPNLKGSLNGYYVYIGGSSDEISLFRQDGSQTEKIIAGVESSVDMGFVDTYVRVTRDEVGNWELERDTTGANTTYISEGTVFDDTYVQTFFFGVYCDYTQTRSDKFFFDNFNITGDAFFDPDPPVLVEATPTSQTTVAVQFDKVVTELSAENINNYELDNGFGNPTTASRDAGDFTVVNLTFANPFDIGLVYTLTTDNIEDLSGNVSGEQTANVQYVEAQQPVYGDIIINEFIPKESPAIGLPEVQFVELYNRSNKFFHLDGWKLSDGIGTGTIQDEWLYPGEYLLLVPTSGLSSYPNAINVTNWGSLNNTGDDIILETEDSVLVDAIAYTDDWYRDPLKTGGGWSIERINPELNCSGADNWRASEFLSGGTPGSQNSVYDLTPDTISPSMESVLVINDSTVRFMFNEGMDSLSLANADLWVDPLLFEEVRLIDEVYPKVFDIVFDEPLVTNQVYEFELENVSDCSGNTTNFSGDFVLPDSASVGDVIINEILHNTLTGGSDFVELYNTSDKYINLLGWELANVTDDTIGSNREIEIDYVLAPDDYVVITKDSTFQIMNYPFAIPGKFIQLESTPTYTNSGSTVYLIHEDEVMDEVAYTDEWHFGLLQSQNGVSLERFDPNGPSDDPNNWHSAAESVGFATPGRVNSQRLNPGTNGTLTLSNNSFSPDGDGTDDVLLITYELEKAELSGKLVIYDDLGREIRTLFSEELLGVSGTVKWDGIRDNGNKASIGPYIILFEAFDINNGEKISIRKVVTLAGQL